jgi:hypothetical protein
MSEEKLDGALEGRPRRRRLLVTATLLGVCAAVLFALFWMADYLWLSTVPPGHPGPLSLLLALDSATLENALGSLAQVIVAVLAIAITVVSIVVQLAATRYTSRIADMFLPRPHQPRHHGLLRGGLSQRRLGEPGGLGQLRAARHRGDDDGGGDGELVAAHPYFAHVFDFLDPERSSCASGSSRSTPSSTRSASTSPRARRSPPQPRAPGRRGGERRLPEGQGDRRPGHLGAAPVPGALSDGQGDAAGGWFVLGPRIREDPDFIALTPASVSELEAQRSWLEWKALRHLRTVFAEAVKQLPELAHVVAIETRYVGEAALGTNDAAVVGVVVKFFNTYVRTALNARDVRASYNVLHQYRQLAERLLRDGDDDAVPRSASASATTADRARPGPRLRDRDGRLRPGTLCERAFERRRAATTSSCARSSRWTRRPRPRPRSRRCAACARRS